MRFDRCADSCGLYQGGRWGWQLGHKIKPQLERRGVDAAQKANYTLLQCGRGGMVDATDSKSVIARCVGSSPTARTKS